MESKKEMAGSYRYKKKYLFDVYKYSEYRMVRDLATLLQSVISFLRFSNGGMAQNGC